jgi:hypothetical protein
VAIAAECAVSDGEVEDVIAVQCTALQSAGVVAADGGQTGQQQDSRNRRGARIAVTKFLLLCTAMRVVYACGVLGVQGKEGDASSCMCRAIETYCAGFCIEDSHLPCTYVLVSCCDDPRQPS